MKEKIRWLIGITEILAGFAFFIVAQAEMASNSRYTWRRPYTDYEQQVIITKWVGLALLIAGIIDVGIRLYKLMYTNKHTEEINELTKLGGVVRCTKCRLAVAANTKTCPRCGTLLENNSSKSSEKNINKIKKRE